MHVLVGSGLVLYSRETWLNTPQRRVYVPVRTRLDLCVLQIWIYAPGRVCTYPFMLVRPENLAVRPCTSVHVPVCASLGLYASKTWFNPPYEYARARSSPFGPARP